MHVQRRCAGRIGQKKGKDPAENICARRVLHSTCEAELTAAMGAQTFRKKKAGLGKVMNKSVQAVMEGIRLIQHN